MEVLKITDLSFAFKKNEEILSSVSFSLNEGEILGILGPSGTGKSSLLRLITGLEKPTEGEISYYGNKISGKNIFVPPHKRGIGLVLQEKVLFPHLNSLENVKFGIKGPEKKREKKALFFLKLLKAEKLSESFPNSLSGGEPQRVAIARTLAPEPKLILLDEPFSSLDKDLRAELREETKELFKKTNTTCIIVTHDQEDVDIFCDKVVELENGKIKNLSFGS